ncbi:hypothetical protein GCM10027432_11790 [Lysobacter fragariae]
MLLFLACALPQAASATQFCQNVYVGTAPSVGGLPPQPMYQQQCSWVAGAIAFDPKARTFYAMWNDPDPNHALNSAMAGCGPQCAGFSFWEDHAYVAISDDDSVSGISVNGTAEAMLDCLNRGGHGCDAVILASSTGSAEYWKFGALAYDVASGTVGRSVSRFRRGEAEKEALAACGVATCRAFAFQGNHGAIAVSSDGQLFAADAPGEGLISSASRNAKKACKQATGEKNCKVVATGDALDAVDARRRADRYLERKLDRN